MTQIEILKMMRDAMLHRGVSTDPEHPDRIALQACEEALAQPEQEPVGEAYLCDKCQTPFDGAYECPSCGHNEATKEPVYTTPPQRKPLTDEEIGAILEGVNAYGTRLYTFARAIEVKLKEKNT